MTSVLISRAKRGCNQCSVGNGHYNGSDWKGGRLPLCKQVVLLGLENELGHCYSPQIQASQCDESYSLGGA